MTRITNVQPLCRVCGKPLGNPACTACGPVKEHDPAVEAANTREWMIATEIVRDVVRAAFGEKNNDGERNGFNVTKAKRVVIEHIRRHFPAKAAASSDTKELRHRCCIGCDLCNHQRITAADTIDAQAAEIERLKIERRCANIEIVTLRTRIDALRADLAAAREGLEKIADGVFQTHGTSARLAESSQIARRTLAAMKEKP